MKNIIPKDSRYVPMAQQKSCCVPASILIVMYKRGIPLVPQELLGYHMGLTVAPEFRNLFWQPRTGKRPPAGYGTKIYDKRYEPNAIFKKLEIPLRLVLHLIEDFKNEKEIIEFMVNSVKKDKDVLVCFNHGILKGGKSGGGHVCVLDRAYPRKKEVRLIDPSVNQPKWRVVAISKLIKAMKAHTGKSGGFWELRRK